MRSARLEDGPNQLREDGCGQLIFMILPCRWPAELAGGGGAAAAFLASPLALLSARGVASGAACVANGVDDELRQGHGRRLRGSKFRQPFPADKARRRQGCEILPTHALNGARPRGQPRTSDLPPLLMLLPLLLMLTLLLIRPLLKASASAATAADADASADTTAAARRPQWT